MPITVKDIAQRAGVSHPTVSRALHDDPRVAPQTAAHIKQIAAQLGYVPSAAARSLKTNRTRVVGIIVNRISDPFYSRVLDGIQEVLSAAGYSLFLSAANTEFTDPDSSAIRAIVEHRVEGLMICSMFVSAAHFTQLAGSNRPLVIAHNLSPEDTPHTIYHDDRYGSGQLTQHLLNLGHTRIAFVGNTHKGRETRDRLKGFRETIRRARQHVPAEYIAYDSPDAPLAISAAVRRLMQLPTPPTALVCYNDAMAIGAMETLRQLGKHVPRECSVVGFDNISFSAYVHPLLTTFDQPKYELGRVAAQMLLRQLDHSRARASEDDEPNGAPRSSITLRGQLLVRESTAPPLKM
ncbi:MAG: LacI family DNA-binding transcriptional regulator [Chloroflexi bacterium]|nr:LacI family DNA-binding transcriptional regulator [Chloroflexota bacterium]